MAPKRSATVTKSTVKTTRKVVQETVEFSVVKEKEAEPREKKVVDILVEERTEQTKPFEREERKEEEDHEEEEAEEETLEAEKTTEKENEHKQPSEEKAVVEKTKGAEDETGKTTKEKKKSRKKRKKAYGRELGGFGEKAGYKRYVFKVLKQVHPELGVSSLAMSVIDSLVKDMCDRLAEEAANLSKHSGRATMSAREIQAAVQLVLPGELGRHALAEGDKAISKYANAEKGAS